MQCNAGNKLQQKCASLHYDASVFNKMKNASYLVGIHHKVYDWTGKLKGKLNASSLIRDLLHFYGKEMTPH